MVKTSWKFPAFEKHGTIIIPEITEDNQTTEFVRVSIELRIHHLSFDLNRIQLECLVRQQVAILTRQIDAHGNNKP